MQKPESALSPNMRFEILEKVIAISKLPLTFTAFFLKGTVFTTFGNFEKIEAGATCLMHDAAHEDDICRRARRKIFR